MKSILIVSILAATLSGCAVGRHGQLYVSPVMVGAVVGAAAATMVYEQNVVYPRYEQEYFYDPGYQVYFFMGNDHRRHYMPRGWGYHSHGVPGYRH